MEGTNIVATKSSNIGGENDELAKVESLVLRDDGGVVGEVDGRGGVVVAGLRHTYSCDRVVQSAVDLGRLVMVAPVVGVIVRREVRYVADVL